MKTLIFHQYFNNLGATRQRIAAFDELPALLKGKTLRANGNNCQYYVKEDDVEIFDEFYDLHKEPYPAVRRKRWMETPADAIEEYRYYYGNLKRLTLNKHLKGNYHLEYKSGQDAAGFESGISDIKSIVKIPSNIDIASIAHAGYALPFFPGFLISARAKDIFEKERVSGFQIMGNEIKDANGDLYFHAGVNRESMHCLALAFYCGVLTICPVSDKIIMNSPIEYMLYRQPFNKQLNNIKTDVAVISGCVISDKKLHFLSGVPIFSQRLMRIILSNKIRGLELKNILLEKSMIPVMHERSVDEYGFDLLGVSQNRFPAKDGLTVLRARGA